MIQTLVRVIRFVGVCWRVKGTEWGAQLCLPSRQKADLHSPLPGKKACAADCEFVGVGKEI